MGAESGATSPKRVLITGGAGFVGANLAIALAERLPECDVVAFDNLYRRGSELNLDRLRAGGAEFVRGDVRDPEALAASGRFDAIVECSAEPSAVLEADGDTAYPFHTNLVGAYNCLELARRDDAQIVFLSTSRVYPYGPLASASIVEAPTRFELQEGQDLPGLSARGVAEDLPLEGPRTLYGATKLSAELLIGEYGARFGLRTVIDRCGVIAGPWQMGKVDQGVFTYWMLAHVLGRPLSYVGFGGSGKQVRDLLHVDDLVDLVERQLHDPEGWNGFCGNVGGGLERSLSLLELTALCRELTGTELEIGAEPEERFGDVPVYVSDCSLLYERTDWRPHRAAERTIADIHDWVAANSAELAKALGY